MTFAKAVKSSGLTNEEVTTIQRAAQSTWDYVGGDMLAAVAEEGRDSVPRSHVIEIVLDADYMVMSNRGLDKNLHSKFKALKYDVQISIITPAFSFKSYGM